MSYLTERVSYLRGLADGLDLDTETKEGKLLAAMLETLEDMADSVEEVSEQQEEMQMQIDEIDEDLAEVEEELYGEEDEDLDDLDDIEEFSVECPTCGDVIYLDPEMLEDEENQIVCPNCGEEIELEFEDGCDCCDCGHDDCDHEA